LEQRVSKREKQAAKAAAQGPDAFDRWFAARYGDRWPALLAAMKVTDGQVARINPFAHPAAVEALLGALQPTALSGCSAGGPLPPPARDGAGLCTHYNLDAASVRVARALPIADGARILDLCAAPGGKSLILAERMGSGELVANELSAARRGRLKLTLSDYLPPDLRERVRVTGHDATRWSLYERDAYDGILLDAPCSSEAHLVRQPALLADWSPARSRQLAMRQYAMLAAALDAVRTGGFILYATCSISAEENDGVVARLLERRAGRVECCRPDWQTGEATEHGQALLPDTTGEGPMYAALLRRVS
jgi:16S rRNA C967 or C1407 C5-methylase (RsmB/RsmF family)